MKNGEAVRVVIEKLRNFAEQYGKNRKISSGDFNLKGSDRQ